MAATQRHAMRAREPLDTEPVDREPIDKEPLDKEPVSNTLAMISSMAPTLHRRSYVYATVPSGTHPSVLADLIPQAHTIFNEGSDGISMLLPLMSVQEINEARNEMLLKFSEPVLRHIELRVYSSLEGVGLTAAVATSLTAAGIPCNMIAGLKHDHVFVPEKDAESAVVVLKEVAAEAKRELKEAEEEE